MAKEYKVISCSAEEYEFFKEFAEKLSAQMGIELRPSQALKMAVTQYQVKNGLAK